MVPLVVRLTLEGGVMVALVVTLTGKRRVARVRADGRVSRKVRVCRPSFIVTVLRVVRLLKLVKNSEDCLRVVWN